MSGEEEPFLKRWSRRKHAAQSGVAEDTAASAAVPDAPPAAAGVATVASVAVSEPQALPRQALPREDPAQPGEAAANADPLAKDAAENARSAFADVDFEALDFSSDYTRFMQPGVPDDIRNKALRKLWVSDPVLANMDGLHDYFGDYTDKAVASAPVTSLYRVGRGFLSDKEVAEWEQLGKPEATEALLAGFRVRAGLPVDGPALMAVHTAAILGQGREVYSQAETESWAAKLAPEGYARAMAGGEAFEVAIEDISRRLVAFASTKADRIAALFVHPEFVRKGIGGKLLARAERKLVASGYACVCLEASLPGLPFYLAHGYRAIGEREKPSRGGLMLRVTDMEKPLGGEATGPVEGSFL